jgi:MFS family permease
MPGLIDLFFDIIGSTAWLIIIFGIISGFLNDVTLRRLTKASFNLSSIGILDLFLAYFIGMMSFLFIYYYCNDEKNEILCSSTPESVAIFGLMLLFCGRIITKRQGVFFGKLHFSTLFVSSAILLIFDTIIQCKLNLSDFGSNFGLNTMEKVVNQSYNMSSNYLAFIYNTGQTEIYSLLFISLAGCMVLSVIGEAYLSFTEPSSKSLLAVAEKFPSDFKVITGIHKGNDNIKQLLKDNFENNIIIKVRCATKSLVFLDLIGYHLIDQIMNHPEIAFSYQILKSPRNRALTDKIDALLGLPFSLTNSIKNREKLYKEFEREKNINEAFLKELERKNYIKSREYYFGEIEIGRAHV